MSTSGTPTPEIWTSRQWSFHQMPLSRSRHASQSDGSSPWRAGSGSTGGRRGVTRNPSGSNGLISQAVIRANGSRRSLSAAAIAWS